MMSKVSKVEEDVKFMRKDEALRRMQVIGTVGVVES